MRVLVVDALPLVIVEMLDVDRTMDDGLPRVEKVEERQEGEGDADPISRETHIQVAIPLKGAESVPQSLVVWLSA